MLLSNVFKQFENYYPHSTILMSDDSHAMMLKWCLINWNGYQFMKNCKYLYYVKVYPTYRVKYVCVLANTVLVNQIFGCLIQILITN